MSSRHNSIIKPGFFEIFCGPVKSSKTREIINRIDKLQYVEGSKFQLFNPAVNVRDEEVTSRFGELSFPCAFIDESNPYDILDRLESGVDLVGIDEGQFFGEGIESVVEELLRKDIHVLLAGLDMDFRGIPFGKMPYLLSMADSVVKLTGACEYDSCKNAATRTQRLDNNKPAIYDALLIVIDGSANSEYQCRCLEHHVVPGKPN